MIFTTTILVWSFIGEGPAFWTYISIQSLVFLYDTWKDWQ